ncbi:unnamed protein product, partial [Discosporangium mesarthrocarpum]
VWTCRNRSTVRGKRRFRGITCASTPDSFLFEVSALLGAAHPLHLKDGMLLFDEQGADGPGELPGSIIGTNAGQYERAAQQVAPWRGQPIAAQVPTCSIDAVG